MIKTFKLLLLTLCLKAATAQIRPRNTRRFSQHKQPDDINWGACSLMNVRSGDDNNRNSVEFKMSYVRGVVLVEQRLNSNAQRVSDGRHWFYLSNLPKKGYKSLEVQGQISMQHFVDGTCKLDSEYTSWPFIDWFALTVEDDGKGGVRAKSENSNAITRVA